MNTVHNHKISPWNRLRISGLNYSSHMTLTCNVIHGDYMNTQSLLTMHLTRTCDVLLLATGQLGQSLLP